MFHFVVKTVFTGDERKIDHRPKQTRRWYHARSWFRVRHIIIVQTRVCMIVFSTLSLRRTPRPHPVAYVLLCREFNTIFSGLRAATFSKKNCHRKISAAEAYDIQVDWSWVWVKSSTWESCYLCGEARLLDAALRSSPVGNSRNLFTYNTGQDKTYGILAKNMKHSLIVGCVSSAENMSSVYIRWMRWCIICVRYHSSLRQ